MKPVKPYSLLGLLFLSCQLFAQSPGGVKGHSFWLKGNFSATPPGTQAALNYNPATLLAAAKTPVKMPRNMESLRRVTIFTVYANTGGTGEIPVWEMKGDFGDLSLSSRRVSSKSQGAQINFEAHNPAGSGAIIHTYTGSGEYRPAGEDTEYREAAIRFGGALPLTGTAPELVSEFILFEKILNEREIARTETYLALKYGITLEKNYVNTKGETLWNRQEDKLFSNNIAGVGRDDASTLYQKQGASCNTPNQLVIGINTITALNSQNTARINNGDFLVWGDNALPFSFDTHSGYQEWMLPEKKWLVKPSGRTATALSTELKVDVRPLFPAFIPRENFYLVIDRSGSGHFVPEQCDYIAPVEISPEGIVRFSQVYWDADGSGKDVFSFGLKQGVSPNDQLNVLNGINNKETGGISCRLYPNPITNGQYTIALTLGKPTDVNIQVYDIHQRLVDAQKGTGQTAYQFSGNLHVPAGAYTIKVITPETTFTRTLIVQ
jgi:Secretion system C-terminal sorting domain